MIEISKDKLCRPHPFIVIQSKEIPKPIVKLKKKPLLDLISSGDFTSNLNEEIREKEAFNEISSILSRSKRPQNENLSRLSNPFSKNFNENCSISTDVFNSSSSAQFDEKFN